MPAEDTGGQTRARLLAIRGQRRLAEQRRDLLQRKRAQLVEALATLAAEALGRSLELEREAGDAHAALGLFRAIEGPEHVGSAALAARREIAVEPRTDVIMGVRVPAVRFAPLGRAATGRGYGLAGTGARIDEVAVRFERVLELTLEVAAQELRLRRLAAELRQVSRRVGAIDHVVVPRLCAELRRIAAALDEREREEQFRLRRLAGRARANCGAREAAP